MDNNISATDVVINDSGSIQNLHVEIRIIDSYCLVASYELRRTIANLAMEFNTEIRSENLKEGAVVIPLSRWQSVSRMSTSGKYYIAEAVASVAWLTFILVLTSFMS